MDESDDLPVTKTLSYRRKNEEMAVATRRDAVMSIQSVARTVRVVYPKTKPSKDSP